MDQDLLDKKDDSMILDTACCLKPYRLVGPLIIRFHLMNVEERFSSHLFFPTAMSCNFVNIMFFVFFSSFYFYLITSSLDI